MCFVYSAQMNYNDEVYPGPSRNVPPGMLSTSAYVQRWAQQHYIVDSGFQSGNTSAVRAALVEK